jgi:hypothetical protein
VKYSKQQIDEFNRKLKAITDDLSADIIAQTLNDPKWSGTYAEKLLFASTSAIYIQQALDRSGFDAIVKDLVKSSASLLKDVQTINKINGVASSLTGDKDVLKALMQTDLSFFESLSSDMVNSLHRTLSDSVKVGLSDKQIITQINEAVGEKFQRYAETYAQTSRTTFTQNLENLIADQNRQDGEELYWEYVGAEDSKNRDICIEALNQRFFTEDEREQFELSEGIRYNCRHIFVNVTKDVFDSKEAPANDMTDEEIARRQAVSDAMQG